MLSSDTDVTVLRLQDYVAPGDTYYIGRRTEAVRFVGRLHTHDDFAELSWIEHGELVHVVDGTSRLLEAGDDDHPLIYGVFERRTHAAYRNVSSELMRRMLKRAFPDLNQDYCSFRAIHAPLAKQLDRFGFNRPYIDGMLSWLTASTRTVNVQHEKRQHGESSYTLRKLLSHAVNIFVTFSHLPLRIATLSGATLAALSFLYLLYVIYGKLSGTIANPGYASLMSVVLFACGIQLLILGVVGEYIGRLMGATFRRPVYVVSKEVRGQAHE